MTKDKLLRLINSRWRMRLFLLQKLPSAWFMGIGIRACDERHAVVHLPFGWCSQNPFRSTYFAAQCAAGELSTGVLGLVAIAGRPLVSMLVLRVEGEFYKKAAETLLFTCDEGSQIAETVEKALNSGEAQMIRATSVGRLPDGTEASKVWITWSFKAKRT